MNGITADEPTGIGEEVLPMRVLVSLSQGKRAYQVNGVTYVVGARFVPPKTDKTSIADRLNSCMKSDFIHLLPEPSSDTIKPESVCSAAEKEE